MRKRLISILIANVLFMSNVGFTSLAVEQNMGESITASSEEKTDEAAEESDEGESQDRDTSDLYFDDVEYVKIQSFTELPEEIKNQQLKQGGRLEELNFPESLEVSVVADLGRDDRIREQLGRERELIREAEREALEAEEKDKASDEDTEEEELEEETEDEEGEEGEGFSQIIDGEEIYFFGSDSDAKTDQSSAESGSGDQNQEDEQVEDNIGETNIDSGSNSNVGANAGTSAPAEDAATSEDTNTESEPVAQEESGSGESTDASSEEPTETPAEEPAEAPADSGNEGSGDEGANSDDLVGRIISIFRPLMVRAAEEVQEPEEEKEEETSESDDEENTSDDSKSENEENSGNSSEENAGNTENNTGNSDSADGAGEGNSEGSSSGDEEYVENDEKKEVESIEIVSGIEWILDPSRSDADPFSSEEIGKKFVFVPVLVIPDYYYIEAELPTITVDIVEDYFAFDKVVDVDGVKIRVRADEGVFPEGATLFAQKLQEEDEKKVQEKVEEQLEESTRIVKAYTFDIQIRDMDGNEIEPDTEKGRVFVSFETEEVSNADYDAEIYHVIEDENSDGASAEDENKGAETAAEENDENAENAEESAASEESGDVKASEVASADGEKATIDGGFTLKKLEATVVEGENIQAVEAETDGFSAYAIVFKVPLTGLTYLVNDTAVIRVLDIIQNTFNPAADDEAKIGAVSLVVDGQDVDESEVLYVDRLQYTDLTKYNAIADNNAKGVYTYYDGGTYYLIVKKPFDKDQSIKITYDGAEPQIITLANNNNLNGATWSDSYEYPYAEKLGDNTFELAVDAKNQNGKLVLYQWQESADGKTFKDIVGANCYFYKGSVNSSNKNYWYQCNVNGKASNPVQIITPNNDARNWTGHYGSSGDKCYVSNGNVAYTIDKTSGIFDVVGAFTIGGEVQMCQTTNGLTGWYINCDNDPAHPSGNPFTNISEMRVAFDSSAKQKLHFTVKKISPDVNKNFSIAAKGQIGTYGSLTAIADQEVGKLYSLSVAAIAEEDDLQNKINRGQGDTIPSFVITPKTSNKPTYYLGDNCPAYETNDTESLEDSIPGISVSWKNDTTNPIKFDFSFGGAATNEVLDKVTKLGRANSLGSVSSSAPIIKGVKLIGSELQNYAYSLGEVTDSVDVLLTFTAKTSADSGISKLFPSDTTTSSSESKSATSNKYTAAYFDASLTYTKNGGPNPTYDSVFQKTKQELPILLTLELDCDFDDKEDIRVYRNHASSPSELSEGSGRDGTYKIDKNAKKIYIYASNFSTFAVGYKPIPQYTVSFTGATISIQSQKVKAGGTAKAPESAGEKEGYSFKGWYWSPSNPTQKVTDKTEDAKAFNFSDPINQNIMLTAAWQKDSNNADLEASKAAAMADSDNESRAPKTGDDLPIVWLWVLLLVAGVTTFTVSAREIANASKNPDQPRKRTKLQVYLLLAGIIIKTTLKFIARKIKENRAKVLLGLSTAIILVSCIVLSSTFLQYQKAESLYTDADTTYVEVSEDEEVDEYVEEIKEMAGEEPDFDWWDCAQVNLKELKAEYPEVVGWIYFENENISYPIMYSGDNAKYLQTTYTGEKAKAGAIFIDGESTPDFTDPHSLIYGHNMRDLSMFGRLRYYMTTPDYYQDHQYFQIFTEDKVYRYQIFAYEEVADNHDVFWVFGKEPTGYYKMLKEIEHGSYCNSGITTNESDHVITLATCTNKDNERLIVSAVRTDEYDYVQ